MCLLVYMKSAESGWEFEQPGRQTEKRKRSQNVPGDVGAIGFSITVKQTQGKLV